MPLWAWIAIGAGGVLVMAAVVVAGVLGYRAAERRYVLRLIRSRESIEAAHQALADVLGRLAEGTEQELRVFADDADSIERRALQEIALRARLLADELDFTALPSGLIPAAEALADVAYLIGREAGRVSDEATGDTALEALGSIDLDAIEKYHLAALVAVQRVCEVCGIEDSEVYGGGLYL
jgi:hypothetical protein